MIGNDRDGAGDGSTPEELIARLGIPRELKDLTVIARSPDFDERRGVRVVASDRDDQVKAPVVVAIRQDIAFFVDGIGANGASREWLGESIDEVAGPVPQGERFRRCLDVRGDRGRGSGGEGDEAEEHDAEQSDHRQEDQEQDESLVHGRTSGASPPRRSCTSRA